MTYGGSGLYFVFVLDDSGREIGRHEGSREHVEAWFERAYPGVPLTFVPVRNSGDGMPRKEAAAVTDRALRYRANRHPPPGPRLCALCGSKRNVEVGHVTPNQRKEVNYLSTNWDLRASHLLLGSLPAERRMRIPLSLIEHLSGNGEFLFLLL